MSVDPEALNNDRQNAEVKTGSWSKTIQAGMSWRRTISVKNSRATDSAVYRWPSGMKWAYLDSRSTMVRMTDLPATLGSPSTKSRLMSYCSRWNWQWLQESTGLQHKHEQSLEQSFEKMAHMKILV
jgi:hypothetical protein